MRDLQTNLFRAVYVFCLAINSLTFAQDSINPIVNKLDAGEAAIGTFTHEPRFDLDFVVIDEQYNTIDLTLLRRMINDLNDGDGSPVAAPIVRPPLTMKDNPDQFNVLRKIKSNPTSSQRELADELGFSLGKLNYCLKNLKEKGLVKIKNFKKNPNKIGYVYILTPKGVSERTKLTLNFMKRKMKEYDELKSEIEDNK